MNSKFIFIVLAVFSAVFYVSCKEDNDTSDRLKIGMFVVGDGYDDSGYKESCKNGLLMAYEKTPFDTSFISSLTYTQDEIDYFPENGFDALFLAGSLASEQLLVAAENYPDVQFVIVDYAYEGSLSNVQSITYNSDEAAFPLGFLAASWASAKDTENPVVAIIGGIDNSVIERFVSAYGLGVSYFNKKYSREVKVINSFLGTFDDSDYGYEVADSLIENASADVVIPVAGAAGNGALYAAKDDGKWAIGVDADQYYSLSDVSDILLSSCMKQLDTTIYIVATAFLDNPVVCSSTYTGTLANQGVSMAPYHNFDTQVPDSIKTAIEAIKAGIIDGSIDTGY